jgi:hypothetical protein
MSRYDDEEEEFDFGNEEDSDSVYEEEEDLKDLDYQVDEVFESLIEDLNDEQLEDLYNRIGDHLSK